MTQVAQFSDRELRLLSLVHEKTKNDGIITLNKFFQKSFSESCDLRDILLCIRVKGL